MKKGDQKRIIEFTKLSASTVSHYFTNYRFISRKARWKITQAIKQLEIDYKVQMSLNVPKYLPDRYDIYNNLPYGAIVSIANEVGCSDAHVKLVLEGKRDDNYGIIKNAELKAAIHIWKTRFCKHESQL
jgi:hypothetical protein